MFDDCFYESMKVVFTLFSANSYFYFQILKNITGWNSSNAFIL